MSGHPDPDWHRERERTRERENDLPLTVNTKLEAGKGCVHRMNNAFYRFTLFIRTLCEEQTESYGKPWHMS